MTINFLTTPMIKISSTSTLSLNSRFTDMMDKRSKSGKAGRKAVFDSDYEDLDDEPVVKTERAVHYGSRDDDYHEPRSYRSYRQKFNRLRGRIGRPNSQRDQKSKRYSYWEDRQEERRRPRIDDRRRGNYGYEWDKTFKRTDPRVWKRSRRDRNRRYDGGHPLDPLNYQTEERIVHYKRNRGGNRHNNYRHRNRYNYRRSYRRQYRNNRNSSPDRRSSVRGDRRSLDDDLDSYFSQSERHSRKRLDSDLDGYMKKSKKGLDKTIDQYMSAKTKNNGNGAE